MGDNSLRSVVFDGEGGGMGAPAPAAAGGDWFGGGGGGGGGAGGAGGGGGEGGGYGAPQFQQSLYESEDYENEPPLLKELGIDFEDIAAKTQAVLHPTKAVDSRLLENADLAGPLVFALGLGFLLLLRGVIAFSHIYGFSIVSAGGVYLLLNLMSSSHTLSVWQVSSVLGYGLLPVVFLAAVAVFVSLKGIFGFVLAALAISWSTFAATRFFESAGMQEQRYLVAYPVGLVYCVFTLVSIF